MGRPGRKIKGLLLGSPTGLEQQAEETGQLDRDWAEEDRPTAGSAEGGQAGKEKESLLDGGPTGLKK